MNKESQDTKQHDEEKSKECAWYNLMKVQTCNIVMYVPVQVHERELVLPLHALPWGKSNASEAISSERIWGIMGLLCPGVASLLSSFRLKKRGICMQVVSFSSKSRRLGLLVLVLLIGTCLSSTVGAHGVSVKAARTSFQVRQANWPSFGFDARNSRFNPSEHMLSTSNVSSPTEAWSFPVDNYVESSQVVVSGVVYIDSSSGIFLALNAVTGKHLWSFVGNPRSPTYSTPAVANGVVYFGDDYHVYALNAATGKHLWSVKANLVSTPPTVVNGVVYIGDTIGNFYALNAATGKHLWTFHTPGGWIGSAPAVVNAVVYFGDQDFNVYALNAATGKHLWTFHTGYAILSSPAVVGGVVYIGSGDDNMYALNASTGKQLWRFTTRNYVISSPAVVGDVVYIGSDDDNLYALNATTGAELWTFHTGGIVDSSPAAANGVVYIGSGSGNLYALDASSGKQLWSFHTGVIGSSSPTVVNGMVYIGTDGWTQGKVYAFHLP